MKKKIDRFLLHLWALFLPMFLALNFFILILLEYGAIDIEMPFDGAIWLNGCVVLIMIYIGGWVINTTIDLIKDIVNYFKKKKEKNKGE